MDLGKINSLTWMLCLWRGHSICLFLAGNLLTAESFSKVRNYKVVGFIDLGVILLAAMHISLVWLGFLRPGVSLVWACLFGGLTS